MGVVIVAMTLSDFTANYRRHSSHAPGICVYTV